MHLLAILHGKLPTSYTISQPERRMRISWGRRKSVTETTSWRRPTVRTQSQDPVSCESLQDFTVAVEKLDPMSGCRFEIEIKSYLVELIIHHRTMPT
jgi:hypothetical protein